MDSVLEKNGVGDVPVFVNGDKIESFTIGNNSGSNDDWINFMYCYYIELNNHKEYYFSMRDDLVELLNQFGHKQLDYDTIINEVSDDIKYIPLIAVFPNTRTIDGITKVFADINIECFLDTILAYSATPEVFKKAHNYGWRDEEGDYGFPTKQEYIDSLNEEE